MEKAGYEFRTHSVEVSEILEKNLNPAGLARHLSEKKSVQAEKDLKHLKSQRFLVLTADTIVAGGGQILGKPSTKAEAAQFLDLLSGGSHQVITALTLLNLDSGERHTAHQVTEVQFRPLTEEEIGAYVETGEPMDKAGAYGIQGAGGDFVAGLKGPLDNVIGLPVELFENMLKEKGWLIG